MYAKYITVLYTVYAYITVYAWCIHMNEVMKQQECFNRNELEQTTTMINQFSHTAKLTSTAKGDRRALLWK